MRNNGIDARKKKNMTKKQDMEYEEKGRKKKGRWKEKGEKEYWPKIKEMVMLEKRRREEKPK